MQKAIIVRNALDDSSGQSWSYEVDPDSEPMANPLRDLLARGWKVSHTCPMPSELDSCCLVILEAPAGTRHVENVRQDVPLSEVGQASDWLKNQSPLGRGERKWDGESLPLRSLGIDLNRD